MQSMHLRSPTSLTISEFAQNRTIGNREFKTNSTENLELRTERVRMPTRCSRERVLTSHYFVLYKLLLPEAITLQ